MKKFYIPLALCLGLSAMGASANSTLEFTIGSPTVNVFTDAVQEKPLQTAPYVENGRTLVPLASFFDDFGVTSEQSDNSVTLTKDEITLVFTSGANAALVNGNETALETPAFLADDTFIVPLRFTAEVFGLHVDYIASLNTVLVSDKQTALTVNGRPVSYDEFSLLYQLNKKSISGKTDDELLAGKKALKSNIVNLLKETYVIYDSAQNSGFSAVLDNDTVKSNIQTETTNFTDTNKDVPMLSSVVAGALEKSMVASNYNNILQQAVTPSDEEVTKLYQEQYISAKHILIPTVNLETGEAFNEKDAAAALKSATDVLEKIKKGEDFDQLMKTYSKDTGLAQYPDGYSFTKNQMVAEFEAAAYALEENKVSELVKTSYGYHIIKRVPLLALSDETKNGISSSLQQQKYYEFMQDLIGGSKIEVNEEVINSID